MVTRSIWDSQLSLLPVQHIHRNQQLCVTFPAEARLSGEAVSDTHMEKEAAQKPACSLFYPLTAKTLLGCAKKQSQTPRLVKIRVKIRVLPPCFIMRFKRNGSYTLNR
ncbi:MOB kinase activator 2a isoform X1 [Tachysurus ichikawai]